MSISSDMQIGGVVLRSPFIGLAEYEREHGLAENYINGLMQVSHEESVYISNISVI